MLRLRSPVAAVPRVSNKEIKLDKFTVPKQSYVFVCCSIEIWVFLVFLKLRANWSFLIIIV